MKKVISCLLSMLLMVALLGAPASANEEITGTIMIYTSIYEDVLDEMLIALKQTFPNLNVETFQGGTGTIQTKIIAEMEAGGIQADLLLVAEPAYALELKEMGYLHAYKTPAAENLRFPYDEEGYWYPVRTCAMVLAYNPELYSADDVPDSFWGFATDENLVNYISMSNPLTSGTAMASVTALTDTYGFAYFDALAAQNVMVESGSVALTKLETGECKQIMILEESVLKLREEQGSEIEVIYPTDGTIVIPSPIMTIAEEYSPNKNMAACEALTDWFLSEAGQQFVLDGWMHSVLSTVDGIPFDSVDTNWLIENDMGVDWVRCYTERALIRTTFEEKIQLAQ